MATAFQLALVSHARAICADNTQTYVNWNAGQTNIGPPHWDCATFNSYTIYLAMGWTDWPNTIHGGPGYFWPHISETGYDQFLLDNNWSKYPYSDSLLTEGAIIITDETLGHSLMYLGSNELADANNYFGYGDNSIAVRTFPTYDPSTFAFIYIPPDVEPGYTEPNGTGSALTHDEVTAYYNAVPDSWTLADLKSWVQSQSVYSWVNDEIFYLMMGWTEGEDYFSESLEGSYLCGCCGINNCYHAGASDYSDFIACMYLPSVGYYSYDSLMYRGQNASQACVKTMTLSFANVQPEASLFYGEYAGWIPEDYIPYSPLCYDQGIQIWCIPERGWTFPITGTGVRDWEPGPGPGPGPSPGPRSKMPLWLFLNPFMLLR